MVGLHYVNTKSQPFFIENNDDTHLFRIEVIDVTILSSFLILICTSTVLLSIPPVTSDTSRKDKRQ